MAYIGTEGYLVNLELRIGKQHCQKETPDFLRETIELCRQLTEKPLPIRLDSGNDASENIGIFMEESYKYNNVSFIIKRNPRQESKEEWLESVRECCQNIQHPRDGKTVYIGQTFRNVTYSLSDNEEKTVGIRTIYEITERTIDRYGQYFIVPDIELGTYWTNTSCQTKQSLIFTMPTEKVSSITVKSRRTWMLEDSRRESLRATNWCWS